MATTNDLKNGMVLNLDGQLWQVIWFQHHKPGKGGAVVRTKLKNIESGKTVDKTFNADVKVEVANVDKRTMQYLYNDGTSYVFMDTGTYDQLEIARRDRRRRQELPAREPGGDRRHQRRPGALHRAARVGGARDHLHRAGRASATAPPAAPSRRRWRPATRSRCRCSSPGRAGQGRHPRLVVPRPREELTTRGRTIQGPQARARPSSTPAELRGEDPVATLRGRAGGRRGARTTPTPRCSSAG